MYKDKITVIMLNSIDSKNVLYSLRSIENQSYKNIEVIVVNNDVSNIDLYNYCSLKNIRVFDNISINDSICKVSDDSYYVLLHNSDDISLCNKIEVLYNNIINSDYDAIGCFADYMDHNHNIVHIEEVCNLCNRDVRIDCDYDDIIKSQSYNNNFLRSSVLFKKDHLNKSLSKNDKDNIYYKICCNFLINGSKFKNIDESLGYNTISNMELDANISRYYSQCIGSDIVSKEVKKIAVVIIATNKYTDMAKHLVKDIDKYFIKEHDVNMYLFTNKVTEFEKRDNLNIINIDHVNWPGMTILRYKIIMEYSYLFETYDYIYYIDSDMRIVDHIHDNILSKLTLVKHPWFSGINRLCVQYENRVESKAYVPDNEGNDYYFGCFQGGEREEFMKMVSKLRNDIDTDLENKIIAKYWDESFLNRYAIDNPPSKVLGFQYSLGGKNDIYGMSRYRAKIVVSDKNDEEYRNYENQDNFISSYSLKENNTKYNDNVLNRLPYDESGSINKHFCVYPWYQLYSSSSGDYATCCYNVIRVGSTDNRICDIWNNDKMKEYRLKFLNNERVKECEVCYSLEDSGGISMRQRALVERFDKCKSFILNTNIDGSVNNKPTKYDIRISNLCNCRCVMCGHHSSSRWIDIYNALTKEEADYLRVYRFGDDIMYTYKDIEDFKYKMDGYIDDVDCFSIAGGEPFVTDINNKILQYLVDNNYTDMELCYTSNMTSVSDKFIELINNFKRCSYLASIDAIGERHDYIRGRNNTWNNAIKNIKKITSNTNNYLINYNICISPYNVYHVPEFVEYLVNSDIYYQYTGINFSIVDNIDYLSPKILPKFYKEKCIERYELLLTKYKNIPDIKNIISVLKMDEKYDNNLITLFFNFVEKLDILMNRSFRTVFPELVEVYDYVRNNT